MQMKANVVSLGCVVIATLIAMVFGLRSVARAVGMCQPARVIQVSDPEELAAKHPRVSHYDPHSPDAYREELLK